LSFNQLSVNIIAQNLASAEFSRVASDAGAMAAEVSSQRMEIHAENFASPEINRVAEDAARVKAEVEASPITLSFAPIEAPVIPPIDVSSFANAKVAFNEVSVSAVEMDKNVNMSMRTMAGGIRTTSIMGTQLISLASDFGIVDAETSKYLRTITLTVSLVSTAARMYTFLTAMTTAHTTAVATGTTVESANAGQSIATAAAHNIKAAATWVATAAQNALNISHATFLALTGVGIGVIIAAAAAMAYFASQMNAATASVQGFNAAAGGMPTSGRSIQRAGEAELYRRGVE
jgi:hypothetical protein